MHNRRAWGTVGLTLTILATGLLAGHRAAGGAVSARGLLDYLLLVDGAYRLDVGQRLTVAGKTGRVHVEGNFELETGNANPASSKQWDIEAGLINVVGALRRTIDASPSKEAPIYLRRTATTIRKELVKFLDPPKNTKRFNSTAYPSEYRAWLTKSPDFTGFVKEINTGAQSLKGLLPDIDAFVRSFEGRAGVKIFSSAAEVPCGAGTDVQFANASTLQLVRAVEINVAGLNACGRLDTPLIIYSTRPLRLAHADELKSGLTVVSQDAVYVLGCFNMINPKPSAVVSGNRVYHLADYFHDYTQFISRGSYPSLADAIVNFGTDQAAYARYINTYDETVTLPPVASWLPHYAEDTIQHLVVVSPVGRGTTDLNFNPKYGLLEDWGFIGGSSTYNPKPDKKINLTLVGAFINLRDPDPDHLATNPPRPRDERVRTSTGTLLHYGFIYTNPVWRIEYEPSLSANPPPGF